MNLINLPPVAATWLVQDPKVGYQRDPWMIMNDLERLTTAVQVDLADIKIMFGERTPKVFDTHRNMAMWDRVVLVEDSDTLSVLALKDMKGCVVLYQPPSNNSGGIFVHVAGLALMYGNKWQYKPLNEYIDKIEVELTDILRRHEKGFIALWGAPPAQTGTAEIAAAALDAVAEGPQVDPDPALSEDFDERLSYVESRYQRGCTARECPDCQADGRSGSLVWDEVLGRWRGRLPRVSTPSSY